MPSPDRHFANAAIFTHSASGITPNSGDAALYIKSDNKAYIKDSAGAEAPVATIGGSTGATDNLVLRADGTGGATIQNSAIQIDDATTSTQNNVAIINADSQTNSSLVLTPKGTGAFILGPKPDGAASGGDARGQYAVDLQSQRASSFQAATANYSVVGGGQSNAARGAHSVVGGGITNRVDGTYGAIFGGETNRVDGTYGAICGGTTNYVKTFSGGFIGGGFSNETNEQWTGILGGREANADRWGMQAHASQKFSVNGDAQRARFVLANTTSGTTAATLLCSTAFTKRLNIPTNKFITGTINIAGFKNGGGAAASYLRQFSIKNVTATTSLVGTINTIGTDEAAGTSISITADDTNDALKIEVTGITGENWRWVASVDCVEVIYG